MPVPDGCTINMNDQKFLRVLANRVHTRRHFLVIRSFTPPHVAATATWHVAQSVGLTEVVISVVRDSLGSPCESEHALATGLSSCVLRAFHRPCHVVSPPPFPERCS